MPSWVIHLATANEICKKINIDKNNFFIGNTIPDAERHVIKDFSVFVPYNVSHFSEIELIDGGKEVLPNIEKFLDKYNNNLENAIVLGYLTHLLTDYFWNKTAYSRYTIRDGNGECIGLKLNDNTNLSCDRRERTYIKQQDFNIFEKYILETKKCELPVFENSIMKNIKLIEEIPFNESDIFKIIEYLNVKFSEKNKIINHEEQYKLFTEEQIEIDYINSIEFIINFLKENIKGIM